MTEPASSSPGPSLKPFLAVRSKPPEQKISRAQKIFPSSVVIPGREASVAQFGDRFWSIYPAIAQSNRDLGQYLLDFDKIEDLNEQELIREVIFCSLNFDPRSESGHPEFANMKVVSGLSASMLFTDLQLILRAMKNGCPSLHEVSQQWLDDWLAGLAVTKNRKSVLALEVRRLYLYHERISYHTLSFVPWPGQTSTKISGFKYSKENKTLRVPERIMSPVMRWAQFYVQHGIEEILTYRETHDNDVKLAQTNERSNLSTHVLIDTFIARLRQEGRGLPVDHNGDVSMRGVQRVLGIPLSRLRRDWIIAKQLLHSGLKELGGDLFTGTPLPETDVRWLIDVDRERTWLELRPALTACYLTVAAYSGMRDSEATDLRRGCLEIVRNKDGSIKRYKIRGRIIKKTGSLGKPHKWVVVELVAKAIEMAERIQSYVNDSSHTRRNPRTSTAGGDYLFAGLRKIDTGTNKLLGTGVGLSGYSRKIRDFEVKCATLALAASERISGDEKAEFLARYGTQVVNEVPPSRWHWETRQLRRTLAWHIANQPFGVIAGAIQYGHAGSLMFEGYAGSSQSGFRAEVEAERAVGRMEDVIEDYENWQRGHSPAAPMGRRLKDGFAEVRDTLGDFPGAVVDTSRRNKMLRNLIVNVIPGYINDCHFHSEHALCLKRQLTNDLSTNDGPFWLKCDPKECPNSSVTERHRPAIAACKADAEQEMLRIKGQSPLQRLAVQFALKQYDELLLMIS